jgi:hypothetical protein
VARRAKALFAVRRDAYLRYGLGRFKSVLTLKIEAIYSSETSAITEATW